MEISTDIPLTWLILCIQHYKLCQISQSVYLLLTLAHDRINQHLSGISVLPDLRWPLSQPPPSYISLFHSHQGE